MVWENASGAGTIASYTVVRQGVSADFEALHVIALIDLAEGPRMMSQIVDTGPDALAVGLSVGVTLQRGQKTSHCRYFVYTPH